MPKVRIGVLGATRGMDFAIGVLAGNPHSDRGAVMPALAGIGEPSIAAWQAAPVRL